VQPFLISYLSTITICVLNPQIFTTDLKFKFYSYFIVFFSLNYYCDLVVVLRVSDSNGVIMVLTPHSKKKVFIFPKVLGLSVPPPPASSFIFRLPRVKRRQLEPNYSSLSIAQIKNIPSYFWRNNFIFNLDVVKTR
jgi:hypothetical protein